MRTRSSTNSKKRKVVQHRRKGSTKKHTKREKRTSLGTSGSKCIDVETNKEKYYSLRRKTGNSKANDNEIKAMHNSKNKSKRKQMISVIEPNKKDNSDSSTNYDKDDSTFVGESIIGSTQASYNTSSKKKLNSSRSLIDNNIRNKPRRSKRVNGTGKDDNDDALTVSVATMSKSTDDSNTVSDTDNESGNTVIRYLAMKGRHVGRRKYYHNSNNYHDNESGNTLIKDLITTRSTRRKRYIYNSNTSVDNESGNTLIKDLVKHNQRRRSYSSDESTIETRNTNYVKHTTKRITRSSSQKTLAESTLKTNSSIYKKQYSRYKIEHMLNELSKQ